MENNIWKVYPTLEQLNERGKNTAVEYLDIQITEIGNDFLIGTMPVDQRHVQPLRILHGGMSVVLAESLGSIAANLAVDVTKEYCVGLEINANHIRPIMEGDTATGKAQAIHLGKTTQIWSIEIRNGKGQLTCISRLTMAVKTR
jgi:1,4-dihydroxy-2-naphthoyl-CoA hydrolase